MDPICAYCGHPIDSDDSEGWRHREPDYVRGRGLFWCYDGEWRPTRVRPWGEAA